MSLLRGAKEFFGLTPVDEINDQAYYDEPRYSDDGAAAYQPRYEAESRGAATPRRAYEPTIVKVAPHSYEDAAEIGEPFRDGDAVVFDLGMVSRGDAKRVIDFAAGLCFAARGQMINLAKGYDSSRLVFAIVPYDSGISHSELRSAARIR